MDMLSGIFCTYFLLVDVAYLYSPVTWTMSIRSALRDVSCLQFVFLRCML